MTTARDLRRITTIGDSVFAVVVTLMAHRVRLPTADALRAWDLRAVAPFLTDLLAVVMSFFVASMFWLAYWRVARRLRRADIAFVASSLAFIGSLVLLPISTRLISDSFPVSPPASIAYSLNLFLAALTQVFVRLSARQLNPAAFPATPRLLLVPFMLMVLFGSAAIVSLWYPRFAYYFWLLAFAGRLVDRRWGMGPDAGPARPS